MYETLKELSQTTNAVIKPKYAVSLEEVAGVRKVDEIFHNNEARQEKNHHRSCSAPSLAHKDIAFCGLDGGFPKHRMMTADDVRHCEDARSLLQNATTCFRT